MRAAVSPKLPELYVRQFGVLMPVKIRERAEKLFLAWEDPDNGRPLTVYLGRLIERSAAPAQLSLLDSFKT